GGLRSRGVGAHPRRDLAGAMRRRAQVGAGGARQGDERLRSRGRTGFHRGRLTMAFNFVLGALILGGVLIAWSLRILREYERGVVFQLGRFWMVKGPGLIV